jgi:hypothetical protein
MRTKTIVKKQSCLPFWLQWLLVSRKRKLNASQAATYLKTNIRYIYYLVCYYYLPSHKTPKSRLYFVKKEIDTWLRVRHRKDFPKSLRKSRAKSARLNPNL